MLGPDPGTPQRGAAIQRRLGWETRSCRRAESMSLIWTWVASERRRPPLKTVMRKIRANGSPSVATVINRSISSLLKTRGAAPGARAA